jgi:hypothetical protein
MRVADAESSALDDCDSVKEVDSDTDHSVESECVGSTDMLIDLDCVKSTVGLSVIASVTDCENVPEAVIVVESVIGAVFE